MVSNMLFFQKNIPSVGLHRARILIFHNIPFPMTARSTLCLLCLLTIFTSCSGQGQQRPQQQWSVPGSHAKAALGDTVSRIDSATWLIYQDQHNNYWFGTDGQGVYRYDGRHILHFTTRQGLSNDRVREIKEDKAGNIYVNTLDGINRFDGHAFTTLPVSGKGEWKLGPDDLWFKGVQGKNGPYRYDGQRLYDLEFPRHYLEDQFYKDNGRMPWGPYEIYSIYTDKWGAVWFGTSNFGICRWDGHTLSWLYESHLTNTPSGGSFGIRSVTEDKNGEFWSCNTRYRYDIAPGDSVSGGYHYMKYRRRDGIMGLRSQTGQDHIYFLSVLEDKGVLWMVTYDQGVWRYDGKTTKRYAVKKGGKDITTFSIYKDRRGYLWLGTHNGGPYKFNGTAFEPFRP